MIFNLSEKENCKVFLESLERMVKCTYPDYKINDELYKKPVETIGIEEIGNGLYDLRNDDEMIEMSRKYLKTFVLGERDEYEFDSIEWQLANLKELVEIRSHDHPILYIDEYRKVYEKIFK